jgi:hypothetical protein
MDINSYKDDKEPIIDDQPTPPKWELYVFTTLEVMLLLLILRLIWLISVYIYRFGKRNVDLFIVASFVILGLAVLDRCAINFANYYFAFTYVDLETTLKYEDWYQ